MTQSSPRSFNPCLLDENEQIPAKIWELLRRNGPFRAAVQNLRNFDIQERAAREKTRKYHGAAWQKSWQLVKRVSEQHSFAGVALQWLVPEPLFRCYIVARPRGKGRKQRGKHALQILSVGEGTTPNINDKSWSWRNPKKPHIGGHPVRRGPEVYWTDGKFKPLRDGVNPIREWRQYLWPFTVEHSWPDAPAQFRREFLFIWRRQFDCRPANPITNKRDDSPAPHETPFFYDWNLTDFRASGQLTKGDAFQVIRFDELAANYRLFAIPKTVLTKASAGAMGQWLADELKKGSVLYGDLLKAGLLNHGEMFGTSSEWTDWLSPKTSLPAGTTKDTHFYRRCRYLNSLVARIFPKFEVAGLLAPPLHRARGKKYVRK